MKKSTLIVGIIVILTGIGMGAAYVFGGISRSGDAGTAITPQAQTERLTSYFLLRKIDRLRDRAVYIQHREEGRKLLELSGMISFESSPPETSASESSSPPPALPPSL